MPTMATRYFHLTCFLSQCRDYILVPVPHRVVGDVMFLAIYVCPSVCSGWIFTKITALMHFGTEMLQIL